MALDPSNSSNLEQLALKGLILQGKETALRTVVVAISLLLRHPMPKIYNDVFESVKS